MPTSPPSTRDRGRAAERSVADYLESQGLEILDRNYESAGAELDLVARAPNPDGPPTIVFIEVRSRASTLHGSPLETVDRRKQRQILRAATAWLVEHDLWERAETRFDVIAVTPEGPTWIPNAFEA